MAAEVDLDGKPSVAMWPAENAWLSSLLRDVWGAFREGYAGAREETARRLGNGKATEKKGA